MEKLSKEQLSEMLFRMYLVRLSEEAIENLFHHGLVRGPLHLYIGEEAVAVGACSALNKDDYVVSSHRGHGHCIAKGGDLRKMMAELMGRETGYCRGRGGSMHLADLDIGLLASSGIVGGGIPIAVGSGFSSQYRSSKQVTVSFFGDGASNQGTFHESLNLAAIWKLPIVFVCENNLYAITCPSSKTVPVKDIADRAVSYGIPGKVVDGMDVLAVYGAVREAVERARADEGPSLIECKTYRFKGHWVGDPIVYRTEDELLEWKKKDPITNLRTFLAENKYLTESEMDAVEKQAAEQVNKAVEAAKGDALPDPETVAEYVYC